MAIYICDTRNQKDSFVVEGLEKRGNKVMRSKLPFGDVCLSTNLLKCVDLKSSGGGLIELSRNICSQDHQRLKREIDLCASFGGEITFLCFEPNINCIEDISKWQIPTFSKWYKDKSKRGQPMTRVKPETLMKAIRTMSEPNHYPCKVSFEFTTKEKCGDKIIEILNK